MKKQLFLFTFILVLATNLLAQGTWIQQSSLERYGRYLAIGFTLNNKGYVGLGQVTGGYHKYDFWEFNPLTHAWIQKADYPGGGSYGVTGFAINGKGYVCLGQDSLNVIHNDLWEYDPILDSWTQKASFPGTARYGATCFVVGNTAIVGTGSMGNSGAYLSDLWAYSPSSNTWTQKNDFPGGPRSHAGAFTVNGYAYMGTGLTNGGGSSGDLWKYFPSSDSWSSCANLPGPSRMAVSCFAIGNLGYLGMGFDMTYHHNDFYSYNPFTNAWLPVTQDTNIIERHAAFSFTIQDTAYVGAGKTYNAFLMQDMWAFVPDPSTSIHENIGMKPGISIFPNPASARIFIQTHGLNYDRSIVISDLSGKEIIKQSLSKEIEEINSEMLPEGMYFVRLVSQDAVLDTKFIKIK
ncbi:MAG: kelch repeat-containing protein [Bacteroidota bacterium]